VASATSAGVSLTCRAGPRHHTGRVAERLAPLTLDAPVTTRPKDPSPVRRWGPRVVVAGVVVLALLAGVIVTAHFVSIERRAHEVRATSLVPLGMPAKVLVVLARPSQELPMAGTLAALEEAGTQVSMLVMTAEPGSTGNSPKTPDPDATGAGGADTPTDASVSDLLARSNALLGVDSTTVAGFAPGDLLVADPGVVTARISEAMRADQPSAVVTVSDATGHDRDSQAVAGYTLVAAAQQGSGVGRVWTLSRGSWERDLQAFAGDSVDQQVPVPQVSVPLTGDTAGVKSEVIGTWIDSGSADLARDAYPLVGAVPASWYFRFWDREYFALAWGTPVP
jgi:LmbE family N-acetylglucosaminyl deacetylase